MYVAIHNVTIDICIGINENTSHKHLYIQSYQHMYLTFNSFIALMVTSAKWLTHKRWFDIMKNAFN